MRRKLEMDSKVFVLKVNTGDSAQDMDEILRVGNTLGFNLDNGPGIVTLASVYHEYWQYDGAEGAYDKDEPQRPSGPCS
jgi:hypothetical protein